MNIMNNINENRLISYLAAFMLFIIIIYLVNQGKFLLTLILVVFAALTFIYLRFPLFGIGFFLLIVNFPLMLLMTNVSIPNLNALGLRIEDVAMVSMGLAASFKLFFFKSATGNRIRDIKVLVFFMALSMIFQILRNYGSYGMSAPGEFRFRYLILIIPIYLVVFLKTHGARKKLFNFCCFSPLLSPLYSCLS